MFKFTLRLCVYICRFWQNSINIYTRRTRRTLQGRFIIRLQAHEVFLFMCVLCTGCAIKHVSFIENMYFMLKKELSLFLKSGFSNPYRSLKPKVVFQTMN